MLPQQLLYFSNKHLSMPYDLSYIIKVNMQFFQERKFFLNTIFA
ncbi:hypothetical protein MCHI_003322 [Candidatus Magnetoovum chiemensis]|nr:hypothetical protein MCHI_003322 [Candidatus Magnetoovum chiemensis]